MIHQISATQSALSRSEVFWFSFRYPKDFFLQISPTQFVPPWSVGFSRPIIFFVFFSAYLFQMGSEEKNCLQICRCSDLHNPDPTVFYHPRSAEFLALQIRRVFAASDPTVFGHPRSDGFFTPQCPMDFWLSKSNMLWNLEDLTKIQVGCNAKQQYDPLRIYSQQSHEVTNNYQ